MGKGQSKQIPCCCCSLLPGTCRYDKVKIVLKEIINCQYTACMNPTAGSFNITPRMQRQFVTLAVQMPGPDIVRSVYFQIIDGHINGYDADVAKMSGKLVDASIELHRAVSCGTARFLDRREGAAASFAKT